MPIDDSQMAWLRKRVYYTPYDMMGIIANVGARSSGATELNIAGFDTIGYTMVAGEFITGSIQIPYDLDPKFEIGFKVVYSIDVNGNAPIAEWIMQYLVLGVDVAYAEPTQVLDTVIGTHQKPSDTDDTHLVSPRGIALPATHAITRAIIDADGRLSVEFEMQAVSETPTTVNYMGFIMDYSVQKCTGVGSENENPLVSSEPL